MLIDFVDADFVRPYKDYKENFEIQTQFDESHSEPIRARITRRLQRTNC